MKFKKLLVFTLMLGVLALTACSQSAQAPLASTSTAADPAKQSGSANTEPVKLLLYVSGSTFTNTEFRTLIAEPVHKKFPNITIERIEPPTTTTPEELFSSGTVPDLIFTSSTSYYRFIRMGAIEDLREWIKKYNFDTSRLKPVLFDAVKQVGTKGEIWGLPFNSNQHILYYNKDIFDKFGVPYPSDKQMTWDQTLELARQLTRSENGVNYIGIDLGGPIGVARSLALPVIDPSTGKSVLNSPEWIKAFTLAKQAYEIPGFLGKDNQYVYDRNAFMKDRNLAMLPAWLANMVGPLEELRQQGQEVNWDIAPIPNFGDQLGKGREAQVHSLALSSKSKHKDEAFQAIAYILSDEVQRILSRNGRVPAIIKPELEKEFGTDIPVLKGKKVQNVFAVEPIKTHNTNEFENDITKWLTEAAKDLAVNGTDVNTAIRKASESIDKDVAALQKNQ